LITISTSTCEPVHNIIVYFMAKDFLMTADPQNTIEKISRRDMLKTTWAILGGLAFLELGMISLSYMQPRLAEGEFGGLITAGRVTDFPNGSVTHIANGRFYLARLADGGFLALYQRCTHLGCSVPWDQDTGQFVCPCHSSGFSVEGDVLDPPAPSPLDLFDISIIGNLLQVDTSQPIQRNNSSPYQVVYA
jgi:cytochrome b6-f complex iron-sulfur subunit